MANGWLVHFEPTISHLTPNGRGGFTAVTAAPGARIQPPPGSFPVFTRIRLNFTDDAQGPPPITPGSPALAATLEFVGRAKPSDGSSNPFLSMGILNGKVKYDMSGVRPVPQFICATHSLPNSAELHIDYTPATNDDVAHSDWVIYIEKHPKTFDTYITPGFFVQLPWQFIENPGVLQISVRLSINGNLEADENRNTPLSIPIIHNSVPENIDARQSRFTFFGLRNLYCRANAHQPNERIPFKIPIGGNTLTIFLHSSFNDFCAQKTSASITDVISKTTEIFKNAGFGAINILSGKPADDDSQLHWRRVAGRYMAINIKDANQSLPDADKLEFRFAAAINANNFGAVRIPDDMVERIPFFNFYIFVEDAPPSDPTELARSETFTPIHGSTGGILKDQGLKALLTPIIMSKERGSQLLNTLNRVDGADHANLLASNICHEIGHSLGLRHAVAFIDNLPYERGDTRFSRGVMATTVSGYPDSSGKIRFPMSYFGPVHVQVIKRLYLTS